MDKRKRGHPSFKKVLLCTGLIVILLAAALLGSLYVYMKTQYLGKSNYVKSQGYTINQNVQRETFAEENAEALEEALQGFPEIQKEELSEESAASRQNDPSASEEKETAHQFLLIGRDGERENADAELVALLTLRPEREEVWLTTFLPDLYVNIPEVGARQLKTAYAYGGVGLCAETLKRNFGVEIDHYILADLPALAQVLLPYGVELEVEEGALTLNIEDSPLEQSLSSLDSAASLLREILPCITHDIKEGELLRMLAQVPKWLEYSLEEQQIPYEGQYTQVNGILIPDREAAIQKLRDTIF